MLPTPRIALDLLLFLISLLQTLLHTDMLEFSSKGSGEGETFGSVFCFLAHGKCSASLPGNYRVGQRVVSLCFVSGPH